jgi:hypothetical protein
VFAGAGLRELILPVALTAAAVLVRGGLEYVRATFAHHTAAIVQARLRQLLYEHVVALGPAHFAGARTGEVLLSLVEGVQQLETYFGQYLPQLAVAAVTPLLIFGFVAFLDLPVALVLLVAALVTLIAPALWHRRDRAASHARQRSYGSFASDFLDSIQGLGTLKAFGQSGARRKLLETRGWELFRSTMWVLAQNTMARGITDAGIAIGAAAALGLGAWRVASGEMPLPVLLVILMLGVEGRCASCASSCIRGCSGSPPRRGSTPCSTPGPPSATPRPRRTTAPGGRRSFPPSPSRTSRSRIPAAAARPTRVWASRLRSASAWASSGRADPASPRSRGCSCACTIHRAGACSSAGATCERSRSTSCAGRSRW